MPDSDGPVGLLVESCVDRGLRRVVPQQAIAFVGDDERHAGAGRGGGQVVIPAAHGVAAVIEEALVILTKAVVVLIIGRGERSADNPRWRVGLAEFSRQACRAVFVVVLSLVPASHVKQLLAIGSLHNDVRPRSRSAEILGSFGQVSLAAAGIRMRTMHRYNHAVRFVNVLGVRLLRRPPGGIGLADKPIARTSLGRRCILADSHANDIRRVRFEHNRLAWTAEFESLHILGRCM